MTKQEPVEVFTPPNMLKAKVGGGTSTSLDMAAIKRADEALATLKSEFGDWIAADVQTLAQACEAFAAEPAPNKQEDLFRASHDLRGQARTFEFPLVEHIASTLCRLLEAPGADKQVSLAEAHVNAIRIIVREKIKDRTNPTALTLAQELEKRVNEFVSQP